MVALWIRAQSEGHTKIVLLGKPSGRPDYFDLVITSGEVQIPALPNVLRIMLPLMRVSEVAVADAVTHWQQRLATLPRPLIALLVGGPTGPFVFDASVVERLIEVATGVAVEMGGTPYITTSRRTPPAVVDALREHLPPRAQLFQWTPASAENPYLGLLGLADGFAVTGDSISMMVEVARMGKPLAIVPLPVSRLGAIDQLRRSAARLLFAPAAGSAMSRLRKHLGHVIYRLRIITHTRDFRAFHQLLIDRGLAVWVGDSFQPPQGQAPDDLRLVVARIKALMSGP